MPSAERPVDPDAPSDAAADPLYPTYLDQAMTRSLAKRVRLERRRRELTLRDIAAASGLSVAMISKIENGQTSPSLRTLNRLAFVLQVPVARLLAGFDEHQEAVLVRTGEGQEHKLFGWDHGHRHWLLAAPRGKSRRVTPYLMTFVNGAVPFPLYQHDGFEFLYILDGRMQYRYGEQLHALGPGDSLFYDSATPHGPEVFDEQPLRTLNVMLHRTLVESEG